jgi:hypothetical protein
MFCNSCGAKIENGNATFCPKCGKKIDKNQDKLNTDEKLVKNKNTNGNTVSPSPKPGNSANSSDNTGNSRTDSGNTNNNGGKSNVGINSYNNNKFNPFKKEKNKEENGGFGKSNKGLLIALISFIFVLVVSGGTLLYLKETGKLKMLSALHLPFLNKAETKNQKSNKKKLSVSSKSNKKKLSVSLSKSKLANKINKNTKKPAAASPAAVLSNNSSTSNSVKNSNPASANTPQSPSSSPTYVYSNNNNRQPSISQPPQNADASFKTSLSSAHASLIKVAPDMFLKSNIPDVMITNALASGVLTSPGANAVLNSSVYVKMPTNMTAQRIKLIYKITGNSLVAYNYSYITASKPGIYNVALSVNVPSDFSSGNYQYTLTAESPATIEESAAASFKVK